MRDVRLTKTDGGYLDVLIEDGRAVWAYDGTETAQHAAVRLQKFVNESVIGDSEEDYTRWYEVIFDQQKTLAEKELELKRRILGTPGAIRILTFEWEQAGRTVNIVGSVQTVWGEADVSQEIEAL